MEDSDVKPVSIVVEPDGTGAYELIFIIEGIRVRTGIRRPTPTATVHALATRLAMALYA